MSSASEMMAPVPVGSNASDIDNSLASTYIVNSKILVVAVAVLFGVVLFILFIHIYAKWYWRTQGNTTDETRNLRPGGRTDSFSWARRRVGQMNFLRGESNLAQASQLLEGLGLDKAVVELLPTFVYCREAEMKGAVLECAVCLEEFEEKEIGRLLPRCNHSFHLDCIDMWFHSHSNCPLCRTSVKPEKAHQWLESTRSSPYQQFLVESALGSSSEAEAGSSLSSIRSSATGVSAQGSTQNQSLEDVADDGVDLDWQSKDPLQETRQQTPTTSSGPSKAQEQNVSNGVAPAYIPPYVLFWGIRTHENAQSPTDNSALEPQHEQGFHAGSGSGQAFSVAIDMPTPPASPVAVAEVEAGPSSRLHMVQLELSLKRLLSRGNILATVTAPYNSSTSEVLEQGAGPSSSTISEPQ